MSLVGLALEPPHTDSIKAPLRMYLSAWGETANRCRNRSIAKFCTTSWNGRPHRTANWDSRSRTDAAIFRGLFSLTR